MPITSDHDGFWDRVEHEFKVKQAGTWRLTMLFLRLGMAVVLITAAYTVVFYLTPPARGYFFSRYEMTFSPMFWALVGTALIICGAYLRFRAMGPIIDHLKKHGLE